MVPAEEREIMGALCQSRGNAGWRAFDANAILASAADARANMAATSGTLRSAWGTVYASRLFSAAGNNQSAILDESLKTWLATINSGPPPLSRKSIMCDCGLTEKQANMLMARAKAASKAR